MTACRLLFRALLAWAAAAWPAVLAAQQAPNLDLRAARALVVVDHWYGLSPVSPRQAIYRLERSADGSFAGTVQMAVGAGPIRRDTSFAVRLSSAAADSLLRVLSNAPLRQGPYRPTMTHTDDYPSITAALTVSDSVVRFHTTSQGAVHVPWQVSAGGTTYVSDSPEIWSALGPALERMGSAEKRSLVESVMRDPETRCRRSRITPEQASGPTQRPSYAAGEAWFAQDSVITVEGRSYRKHGLPRILGEGEISPYATYRGVPVFQERGLAGQPDVLYVPVRASCEVQPYTEASRP